MIDNSEQSKADIGYFKANRHEMLTYIPKSAITILDIGCGEGAFCKALKRDDREIWGVEINPSAAQKATEVFKFVLEGDFNSIYEQLPKGHFDCIIFNDVLEHLYTPWETIKLVKSLLSPTGVLVTSIPNFRFMSNLIIEILYHGELHYKEEGGILDDTHIRFFTSKSICRMFKEQGYEILVHEGINADNRPKAKLFNLFTFGFFKDTMFKQFATVAKPI
jgi:2-polyprenyl-3-methyl-5-hydroxy-6-metoxy-1,4-benzoquinol methylase